MIQSADRYREAGWLTWRTFELTSDAVVVRTRSLSGCLLPHESRVLLADLDPEIAGTSSRPRSDQHAVVVGVILTLSVMLVMLVGTAAKWQALAWGLGFCSILGALFLTGALTGMDPRQTEWVHFRHRSGIIVLDVGRIGPDANRFHTFVDTVCAAIRASAREGTGPRSA